MTSTVVPVTVVVPVYDGLDETVGCIESVLAQAGSAVPMEMLVIDDVSPNAALRAYLDEVAVRGATRCRCGWCTTTRTSGS